MYQDEPLINTKTLTNAYQWFQKNKKVHVDDSNENHTVYSVSAKNLPIISIPKINSYQKKIKNCDWKDFEDYVKCTTSLWQIRIPREATLENAKWKYGSCTCPDFAKHHVCKHLIGLAFRTKLCVIPLIAKNIPIGEKRKRGRPSKATKSFERQPKN